MYNYFNADCNLALITELIEKTNLETDQIIHIKEWLTTNFVTPHWQDALHITKCFLLPAIKDFSAEKLRQIKKRYKNSVLAVILHQIQHNVLTFYKHRHTFPPNDRDIKQYKTFAAFDYALRMNRYQIDKDWKTARNDLKAICEDDNFTIYCADTFLKSKALTKGHPTFNSNEYTYCTGISEWQFKKYCLNEDTTKRIATMFFIRDKNKTTEYTCTFPGKQYKDPEHIIMIIAYCSNFKKSISVHYSHNVPVGVYANMLDLLIVYPKLAPYKDILIHREDDKID